MTVQFTWSGVPIDPDLLNAYGYNDSLVVSGATLPRFLGYVYAGILQQNGVVTASAAGLVGTSSSSVTIGTGAKAFTASLGETWQPGMVLAASSAADPNSLMVGSVTSYDAGTGALVLAVLDTRGTGSPADWTLTLGGRMGLQGIAGLLGWSPVLALVADGARMVAQVTAWTGGQGSAPASGQYLGAAGLVTPIASAVDLRGPMGIAGSGTNINAQTNGTGVTVAPRAILNAVQSVAAADDAGGGRITLALSGDTASPGNSMVYGTDSTGARGWQSGGGGGTLALFAAGII